jgi:hypothetical protein
MKLWIFALFALLALSFVKAQDTTAAPELLECKLCTSGQVQEKECKCLEGFSKNVTQISKLKGVLADAYCCRSDF